MLVLKGGAVLRKIQGSFAPLYEEMSMQKAGVCWKVISGTFVVRIVRRIFNTFIQLISASAVEKNSAVKIFEIDWRQREI